MPNYYVREEDGTSKYVLENGSGDLITETSGAAGKSGFGSAGGVATGVSASVYIESGFSTAHASAAGPSASVYTKRGFADVAGVAAGQSVSGGPKVALFAPGIANVTLTIPAGHTRIYLGGQFYMTSAQMAAGAGYTIGSTLYALTDGTPFHEDGIDLGTPAGDVIGFNDFALAAGSFTPDTWHTFEMYWDTSLGSVQMALDAMTGTDSSGPYAGENIIEVDVGAVAGTNEVGQGIYVGEVRVGTTLGGSDILLEDWSSGDFSNWTAVGGGTIVSAIVDPPAFTSSLTPAPPVIFGRVAIAFDDGPLEPFPAWTVIDQAGDFPDQFVSGYDIQSGRQTLLSQTDTGTASVYINDHELALFDPRNVSSPYFGKLDGKQILLQLYDPEAAAWEGQFRGLIDDISWVIDGSAVGADGQPINASIQIDCVDMFDYLAGFGLTPGLDGVTPRPLQPPSPPRTAGGPPPAGYEDGVYYAETTGTVDDRIIEILADAHIDSTRYTVASGNVSVKAVKYDPDESALQALRDAADAELPFIANIYCDRHGDFLFRGRYSSFNPDETAAEPGSTWDFQRWAAGDGAAIEADPTRAQLRAFAFGRNRSDLINVAICYPQNMKPAQMPNQVFANDASILAYGKHSAPPMSDLLTNEGSTSPSGFTTNDHQECFLFAKLTVLNQKNPRENIKTLTFKAIRPDGSDRSIRTWALITRSDISHIVNVAVGYPSGTGLTGNTPDDDYYIQGRKMQVRPLNPVHDYVELDLNVTPAVWSMDTHGVFPDFPGADASVLTADFTVAE